MRTSLFLSFLVFSSVLFAVNAQVPTETKTPTQDTAPKHHDLTAALLIKRVNPEYPKKARKQHVEGTVRLDATIAKDGSVQNLEVLSGDPLLVDAALKAVRQWRYRPTLVDGQPREVSTTIDIIFALNKTT